MSGWKRSGPAIGWAVVLFTLSSIPGDDLAVIPPIVGIDKLAHIIVYAILGALAMRAWGQVPGGAPDGGRGRFAGWIVVLFCVGYGITDELHQVLVPGRFPSVWDGLADTIGAVLGVTLYGVWLRRRRQHDNEPGRGQRSTSSGD